MSTSGKRPEPVPWTAHSRERSVWELVFIAGAIWDCFFGHLDGLWSGPGALPPVELGGCHMDGSFQFHSDWGIQRVHKPDHSLQEQFISGYSTSGSPAASWSCITIYILTYTQNKNNSLYFDLHPGKSPSLLIFLSVWLTVILTLYPAKYWHIAHCFM